MAHERKICSNAGLHFRRRIQCQAFIKICHNGRDTRTNNKNRKYKQITFNISRETVQEFLKYKNFVCQEDIIGGRFFYTKQKTTNEFAASDFSSYVPYLTINKFNV